MKTYSNIHNHKGLFSFMTSLLEFKYEKKKKNNYLDNNIENLPKLTDGGKKISR